VNRVVSLCSKYGISEGKFFEKQWDKFTEIKSTVLSQQSFVEHNNLNFIN
jgi:hypothetical protein